MRKCNSCGAMVPDDSRFCSECGSSDIVSIPEEPVVQQPTPAPQPAPTYSQPAPQPAPQQTAYPAGGNIQPAAPANNGQQGYYQQSASQPGYNAPAGNAAPPAGNSYQQPGAYPYAAQPNYAPAAPVKKKKKTGMIIAIVLGVLLVLLGVIVFIGARIAKKALDEFDPNAYIDELISEFEDGLIDETTADGQTDEDAATAVAYTKGELVGDVYTNEWAGIRFTLPENFVNGDEEDYDDSSDIYTDACLVAEYDNNGISFLIEESGGFAGMTVEDYLRYLTDDALDDDMVSQGWSFGTVYSMPIAGETYRAIKMTNSYTDAFEEIIACRIYNDHMLCFICYGDTATIDGFFDSITTP